jgi:hypothetical protein
VSLKEQCAELQALISGGLAAALLEVRVTATPAEALRLTVDLTALPEDQRAKAYNEIGRLFAQGCEKLQVDPQLPILMGEVAGKTQQVTIGLAGKTQQVTT